MHEKDSKRILGEQLNDGQKKGESGEAHRLSRVLAGRGMGARRGNLTRILAARQCSEEKQQLWSSPLTKAGAMVCETSSSVGKVVRTDPRHESAAILHFELSCSLHAGA